MNINQIIEKIIFTDWTLTNPFYFYCRGILWGVVATTLFWKSFIPWLKRKILRWKLYKRSKQ